MARRYREPVDVSLSADEQPVGFTWRGNRYRVAVIGAWRLSTRWWEASGAAERRYFRVLTPDQQVFDLYHDEASGVWVIDICHD